MSLGRNSFLRRHATEFSIFLLALVLRLGYWSYKGTWRGGDWDGYSAACTVWANDPVGIITAHKGLFYAGFTFPFCQFTSIPGTTADQWVVIQILLSAFACTIVYRTGKLLIDETAGIVAGIGLAVLWDTWLWTTLLYSTAMLTFAMVCCLWALARYRHSGSRSGKFALLAGFGFLSISHPMGPPIVVGWVLYEIVPRFDAHNQRIFEHRIVPYSLVVSVPILLVYAADRYWLFRRWFSGEVVYDDPTYTIPVEEAPTLIDFLITNHVYALAIPVARVLLFFVPFFPRNSTARILLNTVTYTPILLIAFYAAYKAWRNRPDLFHCLATPGIVMLAVSAIYTVSWDLRYRAVLGPSMVLLTGFVFSEYEPIAALVDRFTGMVTSVTPHQ